MVGRHVEGPPVEVDVETGGVGRHEEGGNAEWRAGLAGCTCEHDVVRRMVETRVEALAAVDHPFIAVWGRGGFEIRGIGAVLRLRQPERQAPGAGEAAR